MRSNKPQKPSVKKPKSSKSRKGLVASLALACALAYGSIPAFATSGGATDGTGDGAGDGSGGTTQQKLPLPDPPVGPLVALNKGSADSEITGIATDPDKYEPSMSAKIPIGLYLAFGTAGYSDIVASSPTVYGITNTGGSDIKLSNITVTPISEEFKFNAIYEDNKQYFHDEKPVETNMITLHYDDGTNNTYIAQDHGLKDAIRNDKFLDDEFKAFDTSIIAAGQFMGIDFNKSYCFFPHAITATPTDSDGDKVYGKLCTLTYYIEEA